MFYHERMRLARCAVLGLCLFAAFGCNRSAAKKLAPNPVHEWAVRQPRITEDEELSGKDLAIISNALAFKYFKAVDVQGQNIVISPLGMTVSLVMLSNGARGQTEKQLMDLMYCKGGIRPLNQGVRYFMLAMHKDRDSPISLANGAWGISGFPLDQKFIAEMRNDFGGSASNDLPAGQAGVDVINNWISQATNGVIGKCVDPFSGEERFVIANAAAFNGAWKIPFDPKRTRNRAFRLTDGSTTDVPTMKLEMQSFRYLDNDRVTAAMLPYHNEDYAMVLVQPAHGKGSPDQFLRKQTWESWGAMLGDMYDSDIDVELPKWSFTSRIDMHDALAKLGLSKVVADGDFSGFTPAAAKGAFLSQSKHAASISVDENGTQAAAASVNVGAGGGPGFHGDSPFAFAIIHRPTAAILFLGVVNDPSKS